MFIFAALIIKKGLTYLNFIGLTREDAFSCFDKPSLHKSIKPTPAAYLRKRLLNKSSIENDFKQMGVKIDTLQSSPYKSNADENSI